jgi:hypothetical protein
MVMTMSKDICDFLEIAVTQRRDELARGIGTFGTQGYEDMGCYDCDGTNEKCPSYSVLLMEENRQV